MTMKKARFTILTAVLIVIVMALPFSSYAAKLSAKNAIHTNSSLVSQCDEITSQPDADGNIEVASEGATLVLVFYQGVNITDAATPSAPDLIVPGAGAAWQFWKYYTSPESGFYACSQEELGLILQDSKELNAFQRIGIGFINFLLGFFDFFSEMLINIFAALMLSMIKECSFITNTIVKEGWPFIQGFANLGFIFVLLYIALATTLRLETISTSVQRLLPKLLIGALLINFSLVVGGLLIDFSRLIMAAEIGLMSSGQVNADNIKDKLLERSHFLEAEASSWAPTNSGVRGSFWATILILVKGSIFRVLLAAAFGVVAINLFVRYIALLILLIFSPIPYLAFILPKTKGISDQWWGMFLKWVFYGPIVIFFLVIITKIQNIDVASGLSADATKLESTAFAELVHFLIIIALFFVANSVAKKSAGIGSDAIMGFAQKNKRAATIIGATAATGGLGGVAAAALTSRSARDAYSGFGSNIVKRARGKELFGKDTKMSKVASFIAGAERGKDGKLKDGQESIGSMVADRLPFSTSTEGKAAIKAVGGANIPKIELWNPRVAGDRARYDAEVAAQQPAIDALQDSEDLSAAKLMK